MQSQVDRIRAELQRLKCGPAASAVPSGAGLVQKFASCPPGAGLEIILKARAVLRTVDEVALSGGWLSDEEWEQRLPEWFTAKCTEPLSQAVALCRLTWLNTLSGAQLTAALAAGWSVAGWIHWFKPDQREWYWWDARVVDDDPGRLVVDVEIDGWPDPWEALRWLYIAAGAVDLIPEGDEGG